MRQYLDAVKNVLAKGTRKENRTGVDTFSTFGEFYEIDLAAGFPLLTTKEISWKNIVIENLWFLSGSRSIEALKRHGCKFWDAWADDEMNVPSAYGNIWRSFAGEVDQIDWVISELKRNPSSRRMIVSAWDPNNALTSKLPPCHAFWVLNVQNMPDPRVCLHLTQRSCDMALGVPYNIAGYALLLSLICHVTGMKPGIFAHSLVDAHVYTSKLDGSMKEYDHVPGLVDQLKRTPKKLPELVISNDIRSLSRNDVNEILALPTDQIMSMFELKGYDPHTAIKFKVAV